MKIPIKKYIIILFSTPIFIRLYFENNLSRQKLIDAYLCYVKVFLVHDLEVDEFFRFHLYERSWKNEACLEFIGWKKHILSLRLLNPVQYRCATENKLVFHKICEGADIPTPRLIGVYDPFVSSFGDIPVVASYEALLKLVEGSNIPEIIIKPVEGTRGQSILALRYHKAEKKFYTPLGHPVQKGVLMGTLAGYDYRGTRQYSYMIQERIAPLEVTQKTMNAYAPFSYRVTTIIDEEKTPKFLAVYAKTGLDGAASDNIHTGGMALVLNHKGVCIGARRKPDMRRLITHHPETGFDFVGFTPPHFEKVMRLAAKTATLFPFNRCVAWDIVIGKSAEGKAVIQVLEGNNPWNMDLQEVLGQGLWQGRFKKAVEAAAIDGERRSPWFNG